MRRQILLSHLVSTVWAMEPGHMHTMGSVLRRWAAGAAATPEIMADVRADQEIRAARAKSNAAVGGGIAVLSLAGVMSQKASMVDDLSGGGGTSTDAFTQAVRSAVADPMVSGIIIDIDSPGGSVFGTGELAAAVFSARNSKPIYGFVNSLCASAAYWVGAQCGQLFITPGGQAGSVGVYMQHVDESGALEQEGLKPTFISAGKYKTEGNSLGPLDDEAKSSLQATVDSYYTMFTAAIAKGRGVPVASVRSGFGEGRCLMASDALAAGMVDGICSMDDVVAKMRSEIKTNSARAVVDDIDIGAVLDVEEPTGGFSGPAHLMAHLENQVSTFEVQIARAKHAARRREMEIAGA